MQPLAHEIAVSTQELEAHVVQYLDSVKSGATILIVEGGKPIGKLDSIAAPSEDRPALP